MLLLLSSLVLIVVHSSDAWINMNKNLTNRVIHIESLRYRGLWVDCYNIPNDSFFGTKEEDVYRQPRTQYKVVDCGDYVCLESLYRPSLYLYPTLTSIIGLGKTFYPQAVEWAHWRIECKNEDMTECRLFTRRLSKYAFSGYHYFLQTGVYADDTRCLFRILAPSPSDAFVTILETENYSGIDQKKSIRMTEGVEDTISQSYTVSAEASFEIYSSFNYFGDISQSVSSEWTRTTATTFQESTQLSYDIVIPAKTKLTFQQLIGSYGPFKISAKKFKILSEELN